MSFLELIQVHVIVIIESLEIARYLQVYEIHGPFCERLLS